MAHDTAITNVNKMNRLCELYNMPAIFVKDSENEYHQFSSDERLLVAEFCNQISTEIFEMRNGEISLEEIINESSDYHSESEVEWNEEEIEL